MIDNAEKCIRKTLSYEGGFTANPADTGNWTGGRRGVGELKGTNFGISAAAYPAIDIRNLTVDQAIAIYRADYWAKVDGDKMPYGLDLCAFDGAVNSGVSRGVKWIQQAIGAVPDGVVGPDTVAKAHSADPVAAVKAACSARLNTLRGFASFASFGSGWSRRIADVEATALGMAARGTGQQPQAVLDQAAREQTHAAATSSVGTRGAVASGAATQALADLPTWVHYGLLAAAVLVTLYFITRAQQAKARASAATAAATAVH